MDDSLPDLVRDWELDTKIVSDKQTIHTTYVSDPARGTWRRAEEEVWDQTSVLGRGSFGVVSLQKCTSGPNSGNVRAVKEIQVTQDRSLDKFLSREISAIVKFSHMRFRECFVPSFGWYRGQGSIFITMEYLPLGDLQCYLNNPLPDSEARTITEQTLQGIDFMHRSKIAHRDLKPKNILVQHKGPNWWVKLSDFGCSKQSESTSLRTIIGTEPYLAPELQNIFAPSDREDLEDEDEDDPDSTEAPGYSLAVDMWALGGITFRIVTGRVPFPSPVGRRLSRYVAHGGSFPPDELLSSECRGFIVSLMSRSPRDRPSSATALRDPWILHKRAPEGVSLVPGPEIPAKPDENLEAWTESLHTALRDVSGTWSTVIHTPPPQSRSVPDESHPGVNEASGTWSTIQESYTLPPRLQHAQSPPQTLLESLHVNETSGKSSTTHQSLPLQPKPLPGRSYPIEPTALAAANRAYKPRPTIRQDHPLQLEPAPGGPETRKPTRLQASDPGNSLGSLTIPPKFLDANKRLQSIEVRSLKSSFAQILPFKNTGRPGSNWKDMGFRGPPSECVFSADGRWLVSVGTRGYFREQGISLWEHNDHGRFEQRGAHYSTSHIGGVKMALSLTTKRLIVIEKERNHCCSTWEFDLGRASVPVIRPLKGFRDSHKRYADSWAISADANCLFAVTKTNDGNFPWRVTMRRQNSQGQFQSIWLKDLESKVDHIACSPLGDRLAVFDGRSCAIFQPDKPPGSLVWPLPMSGIFVAGAEKWISAFSPDCRWFIVSDGREFGIYKGHESGEWMLRCKKAFETQAVVFSQDSKSFALGSLNGTISIWRLDEHDAFSEHKCLCLPELRSLAFSPYGHFLATTTEDEFDVWEIF